MAVPSRVAAVGCAISFADSSVTTVFSWPCSSWDMQHPGAPLVGTLWNKAFPRVFHTMQRFMLTPSLERRMCRGSTEVRSHVIAYLFPELYTQVIILFFPKQAAFFTLMSSSSFLSGCYSCIPWDPDPVSPLSTTLSPASMYLLSPKEPSSENNPASINSSLERKTQ